MWSAHPRLGWAALGFAGHPREVSGKTAYERYVEQLSQAHPGEPVMSRREFERRRNDERDANPRAR